LFHCKILQYKLTCSVWGRAPEGSGGEASRSWQKLWKNCINNWSSEWYFPWPCFRWLTQNSLTFPDRRNPDQSIINQQINQLITQPTNQSQVNIHRSIYNKNKTHAWTLRTLYLRSCFVDLGMWSTACCDRRNIGRLRCWIASPSLRAMDLLQPNFCISRIHLTYRVLLKNTPRRKTATCEKQLWNVLLSVTSLCLL